MMGIKPPIGLSTKRKAQIAEIQARVDIAQASLRRWEAAENRNNIARSKQKLRSFAIMIAAVELGEEISESDAWEQAE